MQSHVGEVEDLVGEFRQKVRQMIDEPPPALGGEVRACYLDQIKNTRTFLDCTLDTTVERHAAMSQMALARDVDIAELAELDQFLLRDIAETIAYCEGVLGRFVGRWEALH